MTDDEDRDADELERDEKADALATDKRRTDTQQTRNTADIAQNTADIKRNLSELNAGGEERWQHIHASEADIERHSSSIKILDAVKIKGVQFKINVLAAFVLIMLMVIAALMQLAASRLADKLYDQCQQSVVNVERSRAFYDELVAIEKRVMPQTATNRDRIKTLTDAKPDIPTCER